MALILSTACLEEDALLAPGVDPMDWALFAFAARGRRLLRASYRLIDNDERAEASPLLRVLHEYLIVSRWLLVDPEKRLPIWAKDDLRRRDVVWESMIANDEVGEKVKQALLNEQGFHHEKAKGLPDQANDKEGTGTEDLCPTCGRSPKKQKSGLPPLKQMADEVGLGFAYDLAYRLQSQADVHATALVIDGTLTKDDSGLMMIRTEPDFGLSNYDSYELGAHFLLDLLRPISERWPDPGWGSVFDAVQQSLAAIKESPTESSTEFQDGAS